MEIARLLLLPGSTLAFALDPCVSTLAAGAGASCCCCLGGKGEVVAASAAAALLPLGGERGSNQGLLQ